MASLYKRNGTYYAQFYDTDRTPSRKRVSLRTGDKSLARAKLARWERAWQLGEADPWTDDMEAFLRPKSEPAPILKEALEAFLASRREMNVTENTLRTYREVLSPFVRETGRMKRLSWVRPDALRRYIHSDGLASATKHKRYRKLRTFFGYHGEEGLLDSINKPRLEKKLPIGVRPDELRRICAEIKKDYRRLRRQKRIPPRRLLWRISVYWFAFLTGLRRSEIGRLRWQDVDLASRTITLRKQKNRKQERVPISKKVVKLVRRLPHRKGYVFRAPYWPGSDRNLRTWGNSMTRAFAKYRDKAGVREELNFHALRKGFCSELARNGVSALVIKRAARHADIKTSLRYIEMHDDSIREDLDRAFQD